jgi:Nif-specific regulatory protein
MPSLAERREDIEEMARHFCNAATDRHRLPRVDLSPQLVEALRAADWPGNVRQLGHAIEAAAIRAAGSGRLRIERAHLFPEEPEAPPVPDRPATPAAGATFQEATRRFQAQLVREALDATGWNMVEAARRLEIARSHLYTLIRALGIERGKR